MAAATATARQRDLDLVQRHRYGDGEAFAEVYRDYEGTVYNLALRMAGDPFDAADLTQEVFLRVYRHLGKFRGRSSLKTWIFRVALNHCRSRLGRRRPPDLPLTLPDGDEPRPLPDPRRGPEERALAGDAARRVERALALLPIEFREAVVLRDLEEMSYEEIADVLDVRIGTVRSRIARGRQRLREALEAE
jgi:RNA polymerase sigma-70 factor (ECF subfamily)